MTLPISHNNGTIDIKGPSQRQVTVTIMGIQRLNLVKAAYTKMHKWTGRPAKEHLEKNQYSKTKSNVPHDTKIPVTSISTTLANDMHHLEPRQLSDQCRCTMPAYQKRKAFQGINPEAILAS